MDTTCEKNYLLLDDSRGYPFGVYAKHNAEPVAELHGPFVTRQEADAYISTLRANYEDYSAFKVVKIETPGA